MMKNLLIICVILIASISYSQGTIPVTDHQKKEAIKKAQRVEQLESVLYMQGVVILDLKDQVKDISAQLLTEAQQSAIWKRNYDLINTLYEAEKAKKPKDKTFIWILRCIGVAAVGFVAGSLSG